MARSTITPPPVQQVPDWFQPGEVALKQPKRPALWVDGDGQLAFWDGKQSIRIADLVAQAVDVSLKSVFGSDVKLEKNQE